MTKLEKIAVQQIYRKHCEVIEFTKKLARSTPEEEKILRQQVNMIEDEIVNLHDMLIDM